MSGRIKGADSFNQLAEFKLNKPGRLNKIGGLYHLELIVLLVL